ncbi:hypothetical protein LCGC14_1866520 [marine sediment metagenome]|uniref:Uncharacterized protein n=1 Tax=marine sediment metagenome TaxID=412755 RepID=A0A0F9IKH5_9ZZZZ
MKHYKDKMGWDHHVGARFPEYQWWGLVTLIIMLSAHMNPTLNLKWPVDIASTIFLLKGIFYLYQSRRNK